MSRSKKDYAGVFLRGMAMGAADVVPGVSGGTIAFITGIYTELIDSLRSFDHQAIKCLFSKGLKATWQHVNGNFLLALFGGIVLSMASLAKLLTYLLDHHPILVWSAFFGLVVASALLLIKQVPKWTLIRALLLLGGIAFAVAIAELRPAQLEPSASIMFAAGSIAICAMILPGISGSFLLLMMGLYSALIAAISTVNLPLLLPFMAGCVVGLLLFSHLLSWLLHRFAAATMAVLTGVLLGSLTVIWPWKHTLEQMQNRHGEWIPLVQENLLPQQFEQVTGENSLWPYAILFAILGFLVVWVMEFVSNRQKTDDKLNIECS